MNIGEPIGAGQAAGTADEFSIKFEKGIGCGPATL